MKPTASMAIPFLEKLIAMGNPPSKEQDRKIRVYSGYVVIDGTLSRELARSYAQVLVKSLYKILDPVERANQMERISDLRST